jgi:hypothetical protein
MHAMLTGTWRGTLTTSEGTSNALELAVAHDSVRGMTLWMGTGQSVPATTISNLAVDGTKLQWTQDLSGASCKATAVMSQATALEREMMKGKMTCADGEIAFVLRKTTG